MSETNCEKDIFRDTWVRFLGYTNELGEALRPLIPVNYVRLSYGIVGVYVLADTWHKGRHIQDTHKVFPTVLDTLLWQTAASLVIPPLIIQRVAATTKYALTHYSSFSNIAQTRIVTLAGLTIIPFVVHPVDQSVHTIMNRTTRRWFPICTSIEEN